MTKDTQTEPDELDEILRTIENHGQNLHCGFVIKEPFMSPTTARAAIERIIQRRVVAGKIEETRHNINAVIKVIQNRRDDPTFMWHEVYQPLNDRLAELQGGEPMKQ